MELASDQTSCHNVYGGGYIPVQLTHSEASEMISKDPTTFRQYVAESLRRHVAAVNHLTTVQGTYFWDYGNSFLLEASRVGADVLGQIITPRFLPFSLSLSISLFFVTNIRFFYISAAIQTLEPCATSDGCQ